MPTIIASHPMEIYILCAVFLAAHYSVAFFVPQRHRRPDKHAATVSPTVADEELAAAQQHSNSNTLGV